MSDLEDLLTDAVGAAHVLVDPDLRAPYETDWTRRFTGTARCVVRPGSTAEVAAVVRACAAAGAPIVLQGGNTGLVGGGVPAAGEVVVNLTRLSDLDPVDPVESQVTAGAGVTLERLQAHAHAAGLDFGVDLAARSSATVGGLIATNAGGIHVLRHGSMRAQVAGLEAVLADGTVISRLTGLAKDNTGYDLTQLLIGAEGTLGIVTRARLRLVPLLSARAVALVGLASTEAALALLAKARATLPDLSAAELCYADGIALVRAHAGLPAPFTTEYPVYLVLECAGRPAASLGSSGAAGTAASLGSSGAAGTAASLGSSGAAGTDPLDPLLELLAEAEDEVEDATAAADTAGRTRLWAYREAHTEAVNAAGVPVKLDVSVPLRALPALAAQLGPTVAAVAPAARVFVWSHLNEGNLHVNVLDAGSAGTEVTDAVLNLVAAHHGSISSEHGVGRAKARWLRLSRSPAEISAMRQIKSALDPDGLLNPGVILD